MSILHTYESSPAADARRLRERACADLLARIACDPWYKRANGLPPYDNPDAPSVTCSNCGAAEPELRVIDTGIGDYEYWGAPGYDSRPAVVAVCCECDALDYRGRVVTELPGRDEL